jgi:hypothetical protein
MWMVSPGDSNFCAATGKVLSALSKLMPMASPVILLAVDPYGVNSATVPSLFFSKTLHCTLDLFLFPVPTTNIWMEAGLYRQESNLAVSSSPVKNNNVQFYIRCTAIV